MANNDYAFIFFMSKPLKYIHNRLSVIRIQITGQVHPQSKSENCLQLPLRWQLAAVRRRTTSESSCPLFRAQYLLFKDCISPFNCLFSLLSGNIHRERDVLWLLSRFAADYSFGRPLRPFYAVFIAIYQCNILTGNAI